MSKNGGYQILDLKGKPLTSGTKSVIKGSYSQVNGANNKRVVISGFTVAGTPNVTKSDFENPFVKVEGVYKSTFSGGSLAVGNDDGVTYTAS